jgi:hypothetical protein
MMSGSVYAASSRCSNPTHPKPNTSPIFEPIPALFGFGEIPPSRGMGDQVHNVKALSRTLNEAASQKSAKIVSAPARDIFDGARVFNICAAGEAL